MARETSPPSRRLILETLEAREVPATTIGFNAGVYTITNDADNVQMTVTRQGGPDVYVVRILSATHTFTTAGAPAGVTFENGDKDALLPVNTNRSLNFDLGLGDDQLTVGPGGTLDPFFPGSNPVNMTVNGGAGSDTLTVNDADPDPNQYTASAATVVARSGGTPLTVEYLALDAITLNTGGGDDSVSVQGTHAAAGLSVVTGNGDDTVTVLGYDNLEGGLSVTAGGNDDRLILNDTTTLPATADATFDLTANTAARTADGTTRTVSFSGIDEVSLAAGAGNDRVEIDGALLDATGGDVTLNAGAGTGDALLFDDTASGTRTYSITDTAVSRPGVSILYDAGLFERVTVAAGGQADTFNVTSTKAGIPVTLQGGGGDDTFNVGNGSNTLGLIDGPLTLDGQADNDVAALTDVATGGSTGRGYTLTAGSVVRSTGETISYTDLAGLTLTATNQDDTVDVLGSTAGTPVTIDGGGDGDAFQVGSPTVSLDGLLADVSLVGGAGDSLVVDDSADGDVQTYSVDRTVVSRSGRQIQFDDDPVASIHLKTGQNNNTVTVLRTASGRPVTVTGGAGTDTVTVGNGNLNDLDGGVTVAGGAGADTLIVADSSVGASSPQGYTVGATTVTRTNATTITYGDIQSVTLNAGQGNDTIGVGVAAPVLTAAVSVSGGLGADEIEVIGTRLAPATANTFSGGDGADEFTVTPAAAGIGVAISVDGGDPTGDALFVALTPPLPNPFSLFGLGVTTLPPALANIAFTAIEDFGLDSPGVVTLQGSAGPDTLIVTKINDKGATYEIVGTGEVRVKAAKPVAWVAGGGIDRIEFRDGGQSSSNAYTVGTSTVARVGTGLENFVFSDVEELQLFTGTAADTITLSDLPGGRTLKVVSGLGNDTVSAAAGTVAGNLDLDTGGNDDTVTLGAVGGTTTIDTGAGVDSITATTLTGGGTIDTGSENDTVTVTTAGADLTITTGAGNDTVTVGTAAGATLLGGAGNDLLTAGAATSLAIDGEANDDTVTAGNGSLDGLPATFTLTGGLGADRLVVNDQTDGTDNTYAVSDTAVARTTGPAVTIAFAGTGFEAVELKAGTGDDAIAVPSTAAGMLVTVTGGTGDDTVTVGAGALDNIRSAVTAIGGGDAEDRIEVVDSTSTDDHTFALTSSTISRAAVALPPLLEVNVGYAGFARVSLRTGAGADKLTVTNTAGGSTTTVAGGVGDDTLTVVASTTPVTLAGGGGDDAFAVGTGDIDAVDGAVWVEGDGGTGNTLTVDDKDEDADRAYTVSPTTVTRAGAAPISFAGVQSLSVFTGTRADTIDVTATALGLPVTVTAGAGTDAIAVGGGNLANLAGALTLIPGADADRLIVDDSAAPNGVSKTYTVTAATVTDGFATFDFAADGFEALELKGGLANDTIDVRATAAAIPVTVGGGGGNDTINVGSLGNSLDGLLGPVTVNGGAGANTLNVNDYEDTDAGDYTILSGGVRRNPGPIISFGTIDGLVVKTSTAADTIAVTSAGVSTPTTIAAGAGADAVTIDRANFPIAVLGGLGDDTVTARTGGHTSGTYTVSVNGGGGTNSVAVNDVGGPASSDYTIDSTQVTRSGSGTVAVAFANTTNLDVTTTAGNDDIAVDATAFGMTVRVSGLLGNDIITVGGGDLDNLVGTLVLDAGFGGTDRLIVDDSAEAAADRLYAIDATTVFGLTTAIEYAAAGFERVELRAGTGNDSVEVAATAANIPVTVSGGAGDDQVIVGTGNLDTLAANVSVAGGIGADSLEISDSLSTTANQYDLTTSAVVRSTPAPSSVRIDFSNIDAVSLAAGTAGDAINVLSTAAGVPVTVHGGAGADAISVVGLGDVAGPVAVFGGGPATDGDLLVIDDSLSGAGFDYLIEADRITRTTGAVIDFAGIDRVEVKTGSGNDDVTVAAIAVDVLVAVSTSAGADEIALGTGTLDPIRGDFDLLAGAGSDTLTVNDSADADNNSYRLSATDVSRNLSFPTVTYGTSGIEALVLLAGTGNDTITVTGTAATVPVTVNGGAGNDRVVVGTGTLDGLFANLTLIGADGLDALLVDDSGDGDDNTYIATGTTLTRLATATSPRLEIGHGGFDAFAFQAGTGSNVINVLDMDKAVTITGGSGNDTITFGDDLPGGFAGLDGFAPGLSIRAFGGGGAVNRLILTDPGATPNGTYDLTETAITRTGTAAFPYRDGFSAVLLQTGAGADTVTAATSNSVPVSVDGEGGDDLFLIEYLSGTLTGGAGSDTLVGRVDTPGSQVSGNAFVIDEPNGGTAGGVLGGRFAGVENLTGGATGDTFTFLTGGSLLDGVIRGEGGDDKLFGDDAGRTFTLTAAAAGSIADLSNAFIDVDLIFGGRGDDTLFIPNGINSGGLSVFDGGLGTDTADFSTWSGAKRVSITGAGSVYDPVAEKLVPAGFHLTDVTVPNPLNDRHKFKNLDAVKGSPGAVEDTLIDRTNTAGFWAMSAGGESYLSRTGFDDGGLRLVFENFEHLQGGAAADEFRLEYGAGAVAAGEVLISGGGGENRLEMLATDQPDDLRLLPRVEQWAAGAAAVSGLSGIRLTPRPAAQNTAKPDLLYRQIKVLDLDARDGDDRIVVDPRFGGVPANTPLHGAELRQLILVGGAGADLFEIVPDKFNTKPPGAAGADGKVEMQVYGGTEAAQFPIGRPGTAPEQDVMFLYQLPLKVKANFPRRGLFGTPSNNFVLNKNQFKYGTVRYFDMFTVAATPLATTNTLKTEFNIPTE